MSCCCCAGLLLGFLISRKFPRKSFCTSVFVVVPIKQTIQANLFHLFPVFVDPPRVRRRSSRLTLGKNISLKCQTISFKALKIHQFSYSTIKLSVFFFFAWYRKYKNTVRKKNKKLTLQLWFQPHTLTNTHRTLQGK